MDIWRLSPPCVLTSGTMSVSGDFSRLKAQTGIKHMDKRLLFEASNPSPFDYSNNSLLYIPDHMHFPNNQDERCIKAIIEEIRRMILELHGHTLILFTSYRLMERVYYSISRMGLLFPLYVMNRGRLDAISAFRKSGNGVLFASDSAGEGIDLAGDILSGLIVVKLPFPVPDPVMEYERTLYPSMGEYLNEVVVPSMLIKLRQWFRRGIRRKNDTTAFAILDSRVGIHGKYRSDVLAVLLPMPVTSRLEDVELFIQDKKDNRNFLR